MRDIKKIITILLLACSTFVLSACSSGGAGSQTGLNISGRWVGTTSTLLADASSVSAVRTVTMSLAQAGVATIGVTSTTVDGNLLIDGICVITFSGELLNLITNNFSIGPGSEFSFIGQVTNDSISGTFSSVDDDPTDNEGCGTFLTTVSFVRG